MADRRDWVVDQRMFFWAATASVFGIVYFIWFVIVLVGESSGWTDDPGAWAGLPTDIWAFFGIAYFLALLVFLIAMLVRREEPARRLRVGEDGRLLQGEGDRRLQVTRSSGDREPEHANW